MERMVFLLPILMKNSRMMDDMEAIEQPMKCEAVADRPLASVVDSMARERRMKTTIRNALKFYKYRALLKVMQRFRLKYARHERDIKCEVIDSVEADLEQCTSYERTIFLKWYCRLLKRRIDAAIINEKLNYRIY